MPDNIDQDVNDAESEASEPAFEDVEALTKNESPPSFNRGKVLKIAGLSLAGIILFAFIFNSVNKSKKNGKAGVSDASNVSVPDFLKNERDNALRPDNYANADGLPSVEIVSPSGLPEVETGQGRALFRDERTGRLVYQDERTGRLVDYQDGSPVQQGTGGGIPENVYSAQSYPPSQQQQQPRSSGGGGGANVRRPEHSPLIPVVEGSLFNSDGYSQAYPPQTGSYEEYLQSLEAQRNATLAAQGAYYQYPGQQQPSYQTQNMQDDKKNFYNGPDNAVTGRNGHYLGDNIIWTGTIIPGVLVTAVNTDLPGDVVARITSNVYDSRTGKNLLLPQGTILVARYNSSVSYAQSRVQIVWNYLIRPDGYMFDLEGTNGVDSKGMSGQQGAYHENWFQYLKAAGIIAMFTLANSKLTEIAGVKLSEDAAQANAQLTAQLGSNIISRALDIQPTITVDSGEKINVMLNKPVYLPPVDDYPVTEKYTRR
jgi:type IV secretory pathway VirB10-like protein